MVNYIDILCAYLPDIFESVLVNKQLTSKQTL